MRIEARWIAVALWLWLAAGPAFGATKVGNGDDGSDLEGLTPVTGGPLEESRQEAIRRLETLGVPGIAGLGGLLPEVRNSRLLLAREDVDAKVREDEGPFHVNVSGRVYARTFAEPHADTRFFPAALKLDRDQLVALHIHEGLHRALDVRVREDESVVSRLTLAITARDASQDRIRRVAEESLPAAASAFHEGERFKRPSELGYRYTVFRGTAKTADYLVRSMHVLHSDLYPFGGVNTPFGIGIEASLVQDARGHRSGPLGLSARLRLWSRRDFAVGFWGAASLNTLSHEELKNSPLGRDVYSAGIALRKDHGSIYIENRIGISSSGAAVYTVGNQSYDYDYGRVWDVRLRAGFKVGGFDLGGYGEIHLADRLRVSGGAFDYDSGRYRILSGGPEATYRTETFAVSLFGRFLVDATRGATFDYLGNLLGAGVAQGGVGGSVSFYF